MEDQSSLMGPAVEKSAGSAEWDSRGHIVSHALHTGRMLPPRPSSRIGLSSGSSSDTRRLISMGLINSPPWS